MLDSRRSRSSVDSLSSSRARIEARHNRRSDGIGEQVGTASLSQQLDDFPSTAGVAAAGPAEGLAERAGDDIDAVHDIVVLVRAAPALAHEADGVRIVDHHQRVVLVRQIADSRQVGDEPSIEKTPSVAIMRNRAGSGFLEFGFQVGHVVVSIAKTLGFAEPNAVDDLAWFSSSEMTASSAVSSVSNSPPLASKQDV